MHLKSATYSKNGDVCTSYDNMLGGPVTFKPGTLSRTAHAVFDGQTGKYKVQVVETGTRGLRGLLDDKHGFTFTLQQNGKFSFAGTEPALLTSGEAADAISRLESDLSAEGWIPKP